MWTLYAVPRVGHTPSERLKEVYEGPKPPLARVGELENPELGYSYVDIYYGDEVKPTMTYITGRGGGWSFNDDSEKGS